MTLAEYKLHLTHHAHMQFQDRVEPIMYGQLLQQCAEQIQQRDYHQTGEYLHLAGVWWFFKIRRGTMRFITCYGRTDIDIPKAIKWARRHNDRINLRA